MYSIVDVIQYPYKSCFWYCHIPTSSVNFIQLLEAKKIGNY